ncbi:MAG: hypothetical protein JO053_14910 [Acidobacteria bacterium]|nr:hypothetical protein [Acidobacteriota bacterium]
MASIQVIKKADIEAASKLAEEGTQDDAGLSHGLEEEVQSWVEFHRQHGVHDPSLGRLFSVRRRQLSRAGGII